MSVVYIDDTAVPYIHGGGGGGCFAKETLIDTEFSQLPISELEVGDKVWAYDEYGRLSLSYVTETFYHPKDQIYKVIHDYGTLHITKNHWVLKEDGTYQELGDFSIGDNILTREGKSSKIKSIDYLREDAVYNFKVSHFHSYIADGIKVHNGGGGGKGGGGGGPGVEDPNSLFSTDILFLTMGIGEGPVYRINPNGPQDFELNEGNVEDLLVEGKIDKEKFFTLYNTGTLQQQRLPVFGDFTFIPQRLSAPVELKLGNVSGVPRQAVDLQDTSVNPLTAIKFYFVIGGLQEQTDAGDVVGGSLGVKVTIFDRTGINILATQTRTISGKTNTDYSFDLYVAIPPSQVSASGYKFTVEKTSPDNDSSKVQEIFSLHGWTEIIEEDIAYTRTATVGFALKAFAEHSGALPAITQLVKGLLVKVPSNYNQPILDNGDVDWREVEVSASDRASFGYRLQKTGSTVKSDTNPVIYDGLWDGQFVYAWTQNPAWIIYDLLTNQTYGLGIPEGNIDKFSFYDAAVYNDACDVTSGAFYGVDANADGTFRYKPRGTKTRVEETLIGLDVGTAVKERRFILDVQIIDHKQIIDLINILSLTCRGLLYYTGGKISFYQDRPDEMPVALFTEANIMENSMSISGVGEEELLTGVDITYYDATNHYRKDVLRVDDSKALSERNNIENVAQVDLEGVTRKSQAIRMAQYLIAEAKFSRRSVTFKTGIEAAELRPGDLISVAQKAASVAWGFSGIIAQDSVNDIANSSIYLEHVGSPSIPTSFFTQNTQPLALRVASTRSGLLDTYILSNTDYTITQTGNTYVGADFIRVKADFVYNHGQKNFTGFGGAWNSSRLPQRYDLWSLGTIQNPNNIYTSLNDKLFKIQRVSRDSDEVVELEAKEYIANVYVDSDTIINYDPLFYSDLFNPLLPPPAPSFEAVPILKRSLDGSLYTDIELTIFNDLAGYSSEIKTEFFHARPLQLNTLKSANAGITTGVQTMAISNVGGLEAGQGVTMFGKNGFKTQLATTKVLVTDVAVIDVDETNPAEANGFIRLLATGFSGIIDKNFGSDIHVLEVNDGETFDFGNLKGTDRVTIPLNQKVQGGTGDAAGLLGFVGSDTRVVNYSANVTSLDLSNSALKIRNDHSGSLTLSSLLPDPPFYIQVPQVIDHRYFANNSIYLTGTQKVFNFTNTATTTNVVDTHTFRQPLGVSLRHAALVDVFVNGIKTTNYTLQQGLDGKANSQVDITLSTIPSTDANVDVRVSANVYTVPAIEIGDNISWNASNIYGITDSTYDPTAPSYNAWLTANGIFRVTLDDNIKANVAIVSAINITPDPVGIVGNVNSTLNTFTMDYDTTLFHSNLALANTSIYDLNVPSSSFDGLSFGDSTTRLVRRAEPGAHVFKARNVNRYGRRSPFSTKVVQVNTPPIQGVTGLNISEELYLDTTFGVSVRGIVSFNHITGQDVTDYEISYKVTGQATGEITSFNTVKVPAVGVDSDGKIRFTIDNLERGLQSSANNIIVRVTPLNKSIRGSTVSKRQAIIGKTAPPQNVLDFAVGQSGESLVLIWRYATKANGDNVDIDLSTVQIRKISGDVSSLSQAELLERWARSEPVATVDARTNRVVVDIEVFGQYTYLVRTLDTSGNESTNVVTAAFTSIAQTFTNTFKAYNEDAPGTPVVVGITNENTGENNFASFYDSNTGGLYFSKADSDFDSSIVDNANGSSNGWSVIAGSPTDIRATSNATYITQIRDLGSVVTGSILIDILGQQSLKSTWVDFAEQIGDTGITETAPSGSLRDVNFSGTLGLGNILGVSNTGAAAVTFDTNNGTLVSGDQSGGPANVFAIITAGNFSGNVREISGITTASPGVVTTSSDHNLPAAGTTRMILHDIGGMTDVEGKELYGKVVTSTTFELYTDSGGTSAYDTTSFNTFTSGGVFDLGDYSNANVVSAIAGTSNANTVVLGATYFANGQLSSSNGYSNLELAGTSYKLVNLRQYQDLLPSTTFFGTPGIAIANLQFRTSTSDPFNGGINTQNVNTTVFSASGGDGFQNYAVGARSFRYLQFKYQVTNSNPAEVEFILDRFRYRVALDDRPYSDTVEMDNEIVFVDYQLMEYKQVPKVTGTTVVQSSNNHPLAQPQVIVLDRGLTGANISVYFANGVSSHNVGATSTVVDFAVTGV